MELKIKAKLFLIGILSILLVSCGGGGGGGGGSSNLPINPGNPNTPNNPGNNNSGNNNGNNSGSPNIPNNPGNPNTPNNPGNNNGGNPGNNNGNNSGNNRDTPGIPIVKGVDKVSRELVLVKDPQIERKAIDQGNGEYHYGKYGRNPIPFKIVGKKPIYGIVAENAENVDIITHSQIYIKTEADSAKGSIGILQKSPNRKVNVSNNITIGDYSIGVAGWNIEFTNKQTGMGIGKNSIGIFSQGGRVFLHGGSYLAISEGGIGLYAAGDNQDILALSAIHSQGDNIHVYVIKGKGTKFVTGGFTAPLTGLSNNSIYIYSEDEKGEIINHGGVAIYGNNNFGIYSPGKVTNLGEISDPDTYSFLNAKRGNVGIFSLGGGTATNGDGAAIKPSITVPGIGMAAGEYDEANKKLKSTGNIVNYGEINVYLDGSVGMYAIGEGSTAKNYGTINLKKKNTIGMYLDKGAVGYNYGTIQTKPDIFNKGIIGAVVLNGAILKNYGTIDIKAKNSVGVYRGNGGKYEDEEGGIKKGSINVEGEKSVDNKYSDDKDGLENYGKALVKTVKVGTTTLSSTLLNSGSDRGELGMYIDTSGVNFTNPINGIENLTALKKVNLFVGAEATNSTNDKEIKIADDILKPYNNTIVKVNSTPTLSRLKWNLMSDSLTWEVKESRNTNSTITALYLVKTPYTTFAKDEDTYNFMTGLDEKYSSAVANEKEIFNKLNNLRKTDMETFAKAVDEMKGNIYSNTQQRVHSTSEILDRELNSLRRTENSEKIKTFGARAKYETNTAGIIEYTNNAYGLAYVYGNDLGWYAGLIDNTFKFKDTAKSKEKMLQTKLGIFKTIPYRTVNYTISGEIFAGYNKIDRKFLVVDEVYKAKAKYNTYGLAIKNEISKDFKLNQNLLLRPYASLKAEYGKLSNIREKSGDMKLEVKADDYISVKPEIGTELLYRYKLFTLGFGLAYENEMGRVAKAKTKAKLIGTNTAWYNLKNEKEKRAGNVKADLNLGISGTRYGVTANVGYDTKNKNIRGGIGFKVTF